jgi:hypothetical protein
MKYCKRCGVETERYADGGCSVCSKNRSSARQKTAAGKAYRAVWQRNNRDKVIATTKRWQKKNPEKTKSILTAWNKKNPVKIKTYYLKRMYGLDYESYIRLLEAQNGLCYLCNKPETQKRRGVTISLAIDHCHVSGKVRKLLCARCNTVIGMIEEDLPLLEKMMKYLKDHTKVGGV